MTTSSIYYRSPPATGHEAVAGSWGGRMGRLATGELEANVMDVLWSTGGWLTPGDVHETLREQRDLAYTTVMTILVRLWHKGRLERQRDGRAYAYRPLQTREEYAASRMEQMLLAVVDRSTALAHFVDSLDVSDRAQLRRVLQRPHQPR